ncbi:MAG: homoserine/threonine efflux transporter [Cyanobacteria bacterium P01_A01_bin.135]
MEILENWLAIAAIGCLVITTPGPNSFLTMRNSLLYSRSAGLLTALGVALGDVVHIVFWLVGIGVVISRSILLFNTIKWLGAAYLIYMGIKSLRAKPQGNLSAGWERTTLSPQAALRSGFLTCLLNPKVTLFFLALFTQFIQPDTAIFVQVLYGATIVLIELAWTVLVASFASHNAIKRRFLKVSHWVERAVGAALVFFGLRLALAQVGED